MDQQFLTYFPNHVYRYIDLSGQGRPPQSCEKENKELNLKGYESYFTVNGFKGSPNAQKENCTNLNAFFVDIDGRKDKEELEKIKLKFNPTFITETQNGYHIYWLLDEPIYKSEQPKEEWDRIVARWERIEQAIVKEFNADKAVKDIPRILRVPNTWYWKKTGDKWTKGTDGVFKIKVIYKQPANTYSMNDVEEIIEVTDITPTTTSDIVAEKSKKLAEVERNNFFENVNAEFPIEQRDSFKALISAKPDTLLPSVGRNNALTVTACLMRQAGWTIDKALKHIEKVGWHGMEKEPGGQQEIFNTIKSSFERSYTYSYKNETIAYNMTPSENQKMQQAFSAVSKSRKEQDKLRFSTYEREILVKHPHLKKNEVGIIYQYHNGVYVEMSDQDISDMILTGLEEDMLWGYRTKKNVSDKKACLLSIIPKLVITQATWKVNVKNGILNILTKELEPHHPNFVSLIQYPVNFDAFAEAPTWEQCIKDWMEGPEQEEKTRLLKQYCGYILSSSMLYDRALFMVGDGGNGKSTFIDTIAMVIGKKATSHIDLESLYGQFGFKGLIGKRLNIIEEVHGNYYQSNKLKKLISGEQVTIDQKYKDQYTFRPQAKFVFSVNLLPRVDDTSTATERRICCLQFLNNWRDNPNRELRSDVGLLSQELPGILNWMLEGAVDLHESKDFVVTEEQIKMLAEYREENSSVEGFLSQCIILKEGSNISTRELYAEYKKWSATDGGRKTKANITFTKEVVAYGKKYHRFGFEGRGANSREESRFVGIAFSPQWEDQSVGLSSLDEISKSWS